MFVRKSKFKFIENELDEALVELDIMHLLLNQAAKELTETRKASAKKRHPSTSKKPAEKKPVAKRKVVKEL
jgi:hypothetical protein